jgi:2-amino-4-hydroxy-6-hydroxymethyldihydropteridine diphosphokinase
MNEAIILIGSNIHPQKNIRDCLVLLMDSVTVVARSHIWRTKSFGSKGPDFLNLAIKANTALNEKQLKVSVLRRIEDRLGRVRLFNNNAPRTIDLDTILFNNRIIDNELWEKVFIALPVVEFKPSLRHPGLTSNLKETAEELKSSEQAELFIPPAGFFPY